MPKRRGDAGGGGGGRSAKRKAKGEEVGRNSGAKKDKSGLPKPLNHGRVSKPMDGMRLWEEEGALVARQPLTVIEALGSAALEGGLQPLLGQGSWHLDPEKTQEILASNGVQLSREVVVVLWKFFCHGRLPVPLTEQDAGAWKSNEWEELGLVTSTDPLKLWYPDALPWGSCAPSHYLHELQRKRLSTADMAQRKELDKVLAEQKPGAVPQAAGPPAPGMTPGEAAAVMAAAGVTASEGSAAQEQAARLLAQAKAVQAEYLRGEVDRSAVPTAAAALPPHAAAGASQQGSQKHVTQEQKAQQQKAAAQELAAQLDAAKQQAVRQEQAQVKKQQLQQEQQQAGAKIPLSKADQDTQRNDAGFLQWVRLHKAAKVTAVLDSVKRMTDGVTEPTELAQQEAVVEEQVNQFYATLEREWMSLTPEKRQLYRLRALSDPAPRS